MLLCYPNAVALSRLAMAFCSANAMRFFLLWPFPCYFILLCHHLLYHSVCCIPQLAISAFCLLFSLPFFSLCQSHLLATYLHCICLLFAACVSPGLPLLLCLLMAECWLALCIIAAAHMASCLLLAAFACFCFCLLTTSLFLHCSCLIYHSAC